MRVTSDIVGKALPTPLLFEFFLIGRIFAVRLGGMAA
jgi:hypothetical protein